MSNERKLDLSKSLMELAEEGWTLQEVLEAIGLQPVAKQEPEDHEMPEKVELTKRITGILQEIGVPAHIKGYQYLRDAIQRAVENGKTINTVTKTLYLAVAREYQTTPSRVERTIRTLSRLHGAVAMWKLWRATLATRLTETRVSLPTASLSH